MKKKKLGLYCLSALAVFGTVCGLSSCGESSQGENSGWILNDKPSKMIEIGDDFKVEAASSKYFAGYLAYDDGTILSMKSESTVEAGTSAHLYAYEIPEGYLTGVKVLDASGNDASDEVKISDDGVCTFPNVSESTSYTIYLYGLESEDANAKVIRKGLNVTVVPSGTIAKNSYYDFSGRDGDERTTMTGVAEQFLYSNGVAAINTTANGGYQLYSSRLHSPLLDAENYIPGYGYGVSSYGTIDSALAGEETEAYKWFYHDQFDASGDEGNFNYLNSNSNTVNELYSYISASYFSTLLNKDMTSSEYQANLSRFDAPEAVDPDENGASDTYKIYVRVGGSADGENGVTKGLSYRTASTKPEIAAYDKRDIKLEDYLTPFKLMATQAVGWYRGTEQAGESTANRQIQGYAEYYNSSKDFTELESDEEFCSKVGVSIDHSDNSITIKFNGKISPDYAEYQIDGLWSNPISEDFLKTLGNGNAIQGSKVYGQSSDSYSPLDSILCVGPYYTMTYESKKTIAFAKNEEWPLCEDKYGRKLYQIKGFHLNVNTALTTDATEYIKKFEAGLTDVSNIPSDYWDKYSSSPLRKKVEGSSFNGGIFLNTYDKQFWDETWDPADVAEIDSSYEVKPILGNNDFYKGLFVGIDRQALADYGHYTTTYDIQEPIAKATPKATLYKASDAHSSAVSYAFGDSLSDASAWKAEAAEYFEKAIEEELSAGHYKLGTEDSPTEVSFQISSVDATKVNYYFSNYSQNWKDAFELAVTTHSEDGKNPWVGSNGKPLITLNVVKKDVAQSSGTQMQNDLLYNGVKAGTTDGQNVYSVTGNAYDTFNNVEKFKSDDSNGFTLAFGGDTSQVSKDVYYDGKYWSFDTLWDAGNQGVLLDERGKSVDPLIVDKASASLDTDVASKKYTVSMPISYNTEYVSNIKVWTDSITDEKESYVAATDVKIENGMLTFSFTGDSVIDGAEFGSAYSAYHYLDFKVTYDFTYEGTTSEKSVGAYYWLVKKAF